MSVAGYIRVSTSKQDGQRQRTAIEEAYDDVEWFADIRSGASFSREQFDELRSRLEEFDIIAAAELDRLGRSFVDLANFIEELRNEDVALDLVNQPIGVDPDGEEWMNEMMLNMMMVYADAERKMIQERVQEGIDRKKELGEWVGRPPYGFTVDDDSGMLLKQPEKYEIAVEFIQQVKKGRAKLPTARFFGLETQYPTILGNSDTHYDISFDEAAWKQERAKVEAGEKDLTPLED